MNFFQKIFFILYILALSSVSSTSHSMGKQIFDGPPTASQCRNCHDDLERFPMLGLNLGIKNPDRHHRLISTVIPPLNRSKAPDAIGANDIGSTYNCFSCHLFTPEIGIPLQGEFEVVNNFRNCLQCHPINRVTGKPMRGNNVHHETQTFQQRRCFVCHSGGGMGGGGMGGGGMGGGGMGGGGMGGGGMGRR